MAIQREKAIQSQGVALLRSVGGAVYVTGTRRPRGDFQGTCMSPGIPDVMAFLPVKRGYHQEHDEPTFIGPGLLFWEAKAPGGRQSPEQKEFQRQCEIVGIPYVLGDLDALIAWLCARGYVKAENFAHYRQPKAVGA